MILTKAYGKNTINGFSMENKVILDPMMGGGTSIIEALRLGCKVIGCDVNPVAWFVTKKEIERFDEQKVVNYYKQLIDYVGPTIEKFYETRCNKNHKCKSKYVIWTRKIKCNSCKTESDLISNVVIRNDGKKRVFYCPHCNEIFITKQKGTKIKCNICKSNFSSEYKTINRGLFSCTLCNHKQKISNYMKKRKKPLLTKMICVEYVCVQCGRGFKKPSKLDLKLFQSAERKMKREWSNLLIPRQQISKGNGRDSRPQSHGFKYYYQLFNPRQLLCLSLLLKQIKKIPDKNSREYLFLVFSSCLETNNVLCKYETNWGKISALFGLPVYHIPERYGENNLLGDGRGSFPRSFNKMKRGKLFAENSYELLDQKLTDRKEKKYLGENSVSHVSKGFSNKLLHKKTHLLCKDSTKLSMVNSKSVDAVVTDPPYFDIIDYSHLADFFYVWLRLGLKKDYKHFKKITSASEKEIVLKKITEVEIEKYIKRLTDIFKECKRTLKDDGLMIFTFHHSKTWAWEYLKKALNQGGLIVTASHVMRSEGITGYRNKSGATSYDVIVIARKKRFYQSPKIAWVLIVTKDQRACVEVNRNRSAKPCAS